MLLVTVIGSLMPSVLALIPLQPVHPSGSNGFAASIVGAIFAVGLLVLVAKFATTKPKNRRRPPTNRPPS